jgi:hypothetical protein
VRWRRSNVPIHPANRDALRPEKIAGAISVDSTLNAPSPSGNEISKNSVSDPLA